MEQADELMNAVSVFQLDGEVTQKKHAANSPMKRLASKATTPSVIARSAPARQEKTAMRTGTEDGDWAEF